MSTVSAGLALVVALLTACGSPPRCASVVNPPGARGAPFLWRVQRIAGGPVVWLYGTVHNGGRDHVPDAAWAALERSQRFVSEIGDAEPDHDRLRELAIIPSGKGLDHLLASDDWWDLRDALRGVVREDELRRLRPWYAMARLTRHLAPAPSPTMDFALTNRARERKLPIDHLESWEDQLSVLADSVEIADLTQAIRARRTIRCELTQMLEVYVAGDQPAMKKLLVVARSEALLTTRNQRWFPQIETYFTEGAFIAVGLGHVLGETGLLSMLQRAGYLVERARS